MNNWAYQDDRDDREDQGYQSNQGYHDDRDYPDHPEVQDDPEIFKKKLESWVFHHTHDPIDGQKDTVVHRASYYARLRSTSAHIRRAEVVPNRLVVRTLQADYDNMLAFMKAISMDDIRSSNDRQAASCQYFLGIDVTNMEVKTALANHLAMFIEHSKKLENVKDRYLYVQQMGRFFLNGWPTYKDMFLSGWQNAEANWASHTIPRDFQPLALVFLVETIQGYYNRQQAKNMWKYYMTFCEEVATGEDITDKLHFFSILSLYENRTESEKMVALCKRYYGIDAADPVQKRNILTQFRVYLTGSFERVPDWQLNMFFTEKGPSYWPFWETGCWKALLLNDDRDHDEEHEEDDY